LKKQGVTDVTSRISTSSFSLKKKEFGIGRVWKDVSESSFAGQRAMAWAASRTYLS